MAAAAAGSHPARSSDPQGRLAEFEHCGLVMLTLVARECEQPQLPACPGACGGSSVAGRLVPEPFELRAPGRCMVVRCTVGTLREYTPTKLLHVGITDAAGLVVYNFDRSVQATPAAAWGPCLATPLASDLTDAAWDQGLQAFAQLERTRARARPYHDLNNNCFSFALRFLDRVAWNGCRSHRKEDFARQFIEPKTDALQLYLMLERNVRACPDPVWIDQAATARRATAMHTFACDGCDAEPLLPGDHFRCHDCVDVDLCARCAQHPVHPVDRHSTAHHLVPCVGVVPTSTPCSQCQQPLLQGYFACPNDVALCRQCAGDPPPTAALCFIYRHLQ